MGPASENAGYAATQAVHHASEKASMGPASENAGYATTIPAANRPGLSFNGSSVRERWLWAGLPRPYSAGSAASMGPASENAGYGPYHEPRKDHAHASMGPASENAGYAEIKKRATELALKLQWVQRPRTLVMARRLKFECRHMLCGFPREVRCRSRAACNPSAVVSSIFLSS